MKKFKVLTTLILALLITAIGFKSFADGESVTKGETIHIEADGIDITTTKVARVEGIVDQDMEKRFIGDLFAHKREEGPLVILINSRGGRVDSGRRMLQALRSLNTDPTICVVEGDAMSMAFNLLSFCNVRLATKGSLLLAHKSAIGGMIPFDIRFTAKLMRETADDMEKEDEPYRQQNAKMLGLTLEQYDVIADQEVMWSADSLVKGGYLHSIVTVTGE